MEKKNKPGEKSKQKKGVKKIKMKKGKYEENKENK
jgi:hypothetical protein